MARLVLMVQDVAGFAGELVFEASNHTGRRANDGDIPVVSGKILVRGSE